MSGAGRALVLGGTRFVGRHLTEALLAAGWEVTLFNRGVTSPGDFPGLDRIVGNRHLDVSPALDRLRERVVAGARWDVVIDVTGYEPEEVAATAGLLSSACDRCVYVSTGAVYAVPFRSGGDEAHPVRDDPDETDDYGTLKWRCEKVVRSVFGEASLVLRLGLQCGPFDDSDRITWWVWRIRHGGRVLVPAAPERAFATVDTRDVAAFVVRAIGVRATGTLNATGRVISWRDWVDTVESAVGATCEWVWVDDWDRLQANAPDNGREFGPYPMAMPPAWGDWWSCSSARAEALGLAYRPLADTVRDIAAWLDRRPRDQVWRAGMTLEEERDVIARVPGATTGHGRPDARASVADTTATAAGGTAGRGRA